MKPGRIITLISVIIFTGKLLANSQEVSIDSIQVSMQGDQVYILYNISNSSKNEKYIVELKAYNGLGDKLNTYSLYGDINKIIEGGTNKRIIWDIQKDYPEFNDSLIVELSAIKFFDYKTPNILLKSTIYPGWGIYEENGRKEFILMGAASYSLLLSSLITEMISKNNYQHYIKSMDKEERALFFDKANTFRNVSNNLLYAGIGFWVINYAFTIINHTLLKKQINLKLNSLHETGYNQLDKGNTFNLTYSIAFGNKNNCRTKN